jgi:glycosyltransferase involved in cell wall biosynthesis
MLAWRTASKLPYIVSLRGSDVPGLNARFSLDYKLLGPLFRRIWWGASGLYACSDGLRRRALRFLPDAEVGVVPNGVEADRFRPADGPLDPQTLKCLTVGRLSVSKRIDVVISAVELLRKRLPGATLTIAGGGGLEQELRELIRGQGVGDHVRMLGIVPSDDMPELYRRHDLFVTATASEGMSNAMLEAMACGLPIVTTRCEGVEELIADNGIVLETAAPQAMADAVASLACEPARYAAMCQAARRQAERFSWRAVADMYYQAYEKVRRAETR